MSNLQKIEKAVGFIEDNLNEEIYLEDIASEACCSKFHFLRIFQKATGETVFDYIRKRRLNCAANEILNSKQKIWLIASDFQFNSPEAFSRSFKKAYGVSPATYRKNGERQIYFGRVKLSKERLAHYHSKISLKPVFRKVNELKLSGRALTVNKGNINDLVNTWFEIKALQEKKGLVTFPVIYEVHQHMSNPFHLTHYDENSIFHRIVAAEKPSLNNIPEDFDSVNIPEGNYVVFTHIGTRYDSHLTFDYVWGTWMMKNDIEIEERPAFEYYGEKYLGPQNKDSHIEYYLPVKSLKKQLKSGFIAS